MGAGASANIAASLQTSSDDELVDVMGGLDAKTRAKLSEALSCKALDSNGGKAVEPKAADADDPKKEEAKAQEAEEPKTEETKAAEAEEPKKEEANAAKEKKGEAVSIPKDPSEIGDYLEMSTWEKWALWGEQVFLKKARDAAKKKNEGEDITPESVCDFQHDSFFNDAICAIHQYLEVDEEEDVGPDVVRVKPWKTDEDKKKLHQYSDRMKKASDEVAEILRQLFPRDEEGEGECEEEY